MGKVFHGVVYLKLNWLFHGFDSLGSKTVLLMMRAFTSKDFNYPKRVIKIRVYIVYLALTLIRIKTELDIFDQLPYTNRWSAEG